MTYQGLPISIEVEGGSVRYPGTELAVQLPPEWVGYGYFDNLPASDGDSLDAVVGPDEMAATPLFIAEQLEPDGETFLQWKVFLGFPNEAAARGAFKALWPNAMFGGMHEVDAARFKGTILPGLIDEDPPPATSVPDAYGAPRTAKKVEWRGHKIVLEAVGGQHRDSGEQQAVPQNWTGIGYFKHLIERADRDKLDVVCGPAFSDDAPLFLANQLEDGSFRQFKVLVGFNSEGEAEAAYNLLWLPKTFGGLSRLDAAQFEKRVLPRITKESGMQRCAAIERQVDPKEIEPPHAVKNVSKYESLVEDMRVSGWQGRPILAYLSGGTLQALTGSHRIAAAREAGLGAIPVLVIGESDFPDDAAYTALEEAEDNYGRLRALENVGGEPYALMMEELARKNKVPRMTRSSAAPGIMYHGTDYASGTAVLAEGHLNARPTQGKGWLDPIVGRVYLTADAHEAAAYAEHAAHKTKSYPPVVLEVRVSDLAGTLPDEDWVGRILSIGIFDEPSRAPSGAPPIMSGPTPNPPSASDLKPDEAHAFQLMVGALPPAVLARWRKALATGTWARDSIPQNARVGKVALKNLPPNVIAQLTALAPKVAQPEGELEVVGGKTWMPTWDTYKGRYLFSPHVVRSQGDLVALESFKMPAPPASAPPPAQTQREARMEGGDVLAVMKQLASDWTEHLSEQTKLTFFLSGVNNDGFFSISAGMIGQTELDGAAAVVENMEAFTTDRIHIQQYFIRDDHRRIAEGSVLDPPEQRKKHADALVDWADNNPGRISLYLSLKCMLDKTEVEREFAEAAAQAGYEDGLAGRPDAAMAQPQGFEFSYESAYNIGTRQRQESRGGSPPRVDPSYPGWNVYDQDTMVDEQRYAEKVTRRQFRTVIHKAVRARCVGELEGDEVYYVDGTWIRDHLDVDFVGGGNYGRYSYIPMGEIWIERGARKDEAAAMVHERVEADAMTHGGLSYDDAHDIAKQAEALFRAEWTDGHTPLYAARAWLKTHAGTTEEGHDSYEEQVEDIEPSERQEHAAQTLLTFAELGVGDRFMRLSGARKDVLEKVDASSFKTSDGRVFRADDVRAQVMRVGPHHVVSEVNMESREAYVEMTGADLGLRVAGLQVSKSGYQRYRGEYTDAEGVSHKVWIGGEQRVQHGSYDGGQRQRRSTTWVVKIDGEEIGEESSLKGAKAMAEGRLGIVADVAPANPDGSPSMVPTPSGTPIEPQAPIIQAPGGATPAPAVGQPANNQPTAPGVPQPGMQPLAMIEVTGRDLEVPGGEDLGELGPSEWMGHAPPAQYGRPTNIAPQFAPQAPAMEPAWNPDLHFPPAFQAPGKQGPRSENLPPLDTPPPLPEGETAEKSPRDSPEATARTYEQFGLQPNGGYQNIANILSLASPEELEFYGKWYDHAHEDVVELSKRYQKPVPIVAALVAVLSPNMPWDKNLEQAERVLQGQTRTSAYPENTAKALHILQTGDLGPLTKGEWGPKVGPFYESIASPMSKRRRVVVDGHAANVWRGSYQNLQNSGKGSETIKGVKVSDRQRAEMVNDYQRAGDAFGITPQAAQAVSWVIWREVVEKNRREEKAKERALKKQRAAASDDVMALSVPFAFVAELGAAGLETLVRMGWTLYHEEESDFIEVTAMDLEAAIPEPKRETTTFQQFQDRPLALAPAGGLQNIIKVLTMADDAEVDFWSKWYHHAKADVQELATKYNVPFDVVAAVTAVLSPGNRWSMNIRATEQILKAESGIAAYPANIRKAVDMIERGATDRVTGPKVEVFFEALKDPDIVKDKLVLDGHAQNIWRGEKVPLKGLRQPNKAEREQMLADYARAADMFGISVQSVQAITWYIWKSVLAPTAEHPKVDGAEQFLQRDVKPTNVTMQTPQALPPEFEPATLMDEPFEEREVAAATREPPLQPVSCRAGPRRDVPTMPGQSSSSGTAGYVSSDTFDITAAAVAFPNKDRALSMLLMESGLDYPPDFVAADGAFKRWRNQYAAHRAGPRPVYDGGELDAVNGILSLDGPRRVSGLVDAFDRLTVGVRSWLDPRLAWAVQVLQDVPGLQGLRLPDFVLDEMNKREESRYMTPEQAPLLESEPTGDVDMSWDPAAFEQGAAGPHWAGGLGKRRELRKGAVQIGSGPNWKALRMEGRDACKLYGAGTRWCISGSDEWYWNDLYSPEANQAIAYFIVGTAGGVSRKFAVTIWPSGSIERIVDERDQDADLPGEWKGALEACLADQRATYSQRLQQEQQRRQREQPQPKQQAPAGERALQPFYGHLEQQARLREGDAPGEKVVLVFRVPEELAEKFPVRQEDPSPPHVTVLYVGHVPEARFDEFERVVRAVAREHDAVGMRMRTGVETFENHEGQTIANKGIDGRGLETLHQALRQAVQSANFEIKHHDSFIAHATLAYLEPGTSYEGDVPEGEWVARTLEVWGLGPEDVAATLNRPSLRAAIRVEGRRRTKRKPNRERLVRPTWYLRKDSNIAFTATFGNEGEEVWLAEGARVLDLSEETLRKSASADPEVAGLIAAVTAQAEAIKALSANIAALMGANAGGYDAVRTEDRLVVLNPKALERAPTRKRWLNTTSEATA